VLALLGVLALVIVVAGIAGIVAAVSGGGSSGSTPVSGTVLFNSSLAHASPQLQPSTTSSSTSSFTGERLQITNEDANGSIEILPTVHASGSQLAQVSAAVNLYPTNRQNAAGLACRNQQDSSRYAFLVDRSGDFGIFKNSATAGNELDSGTTTASDHYRLAIQCSGPESPGPNDAVKLTFTINGNTFSVSDQSNAIPSGRVAMEVDGDSTAQFANLSISHH